MSHEIEQNDSLFNTGFVPWHGLGTVLEEPPDTIKCALEASGLGWWVNKEPMYLKDGTEVKEHYCTRRADDDSQLGVVGSEYTVLQNEDAFGWFEPMVDSGIIQIVSAGSLRGGRRVWVQAQVVGAEESVRKLDGGKDDIVRQHLLIAHAHDGSMHVRGDFCGTRAVCANTLRMAQSEGGELFRIRHTKSAQQRLDYQRRVVEDHIDAFHKAMGIARKMARTPVEAEEIVQYVADVFKPRRRTRSTTASARSCRCSRRGAAIRANPCGTCTRVARNGLTGTAATMLMPVSTACGLVKLPTSMAGLGPKPSNSSRDLLGTL